jgi:hypothetical protein
MNQAEVHSAGGSLLERGGARARYIFFLNGDGSRKTPMLLHYHNLSVTQLQKGPQKKKKYKPAQ